MWKTQPSKTVVRKGCPEIFSLSRASEISRQYLLFRTIVVGCTPVSLSTSLCLIVSLAFFVNMCRPTRETFRVSVVVGQTHQIAGAGVPKLDKCTSLFI